jgi:hypothetical protein
MLEMENAAVRVISRWVVFLAWLGNCQFVMLTGWTDLAITQRPVCQREKRR